MLPSLQTLNIKYCDAVSEEGLYHLRRCKHLLYLDLSGLSCVSDAVLDQLHGMQPEDLIMDDRYQIGNVTDDGITRFVLACTSLSRLDVSFAGRLGGEVTHGLLHMLPINLPGLRDVTLRVRGSQPDKRPRSPSSGPLRVIF